MNCSTSSYGSENPLPCCFRRRRRLRSTPGNFPPRCRCCSNRPTTVLRRIGIALRSNIVRVRPGNAIVNTDCSIRNDALLTHHALLSTRQSQTPTWMALAADHELTALAVLTCDVIHFDDVINTKINQSEATKSAKVVGLTSDVINFDDVINTKINQSEASKSAKVGTITTLPTLGTLRN